MTVLRYLGHGIGRAVCELENNVVIKIPFNQNGVLQNRTEKVNYEKAPFWRATIIGYDEDKDWLYMEKVNDKSEYFKDYVRDEVHCEIYDELMTPVRKCECNGKCSICPHNVLENLIPENIDAILEYNPKEKIQIGTNSDGDYRYFDYADQYMRQPGDAKFFDSMGEWAVRYLEEEPEMTFAEYLTEHDAWGGKDDIDNRLIFKQARIAWTKWNSKINEK
ncbi:MAG: hypothetical protein J6S67_23570 [Methanobrevibacter sp.]|nr:hypothetical protein [Methanobrevibacter sp.]